MLSPPRSAIQKCSPVRARWSYRGRRNPHIRAISSGSVPPGAAMVPVRCMKSTRDFRNTSKVAYESAPVARLRAIAGSSKFHHKSRYPLWLARRNEGIGCWEDSPPATFAGQDEATEGNRRGGGAPSAGDNRDGGLK